MATTQNVSGFASSLCRCGRTSALNDNSKIARRRLECGHYICADCWHYTDPLPTPICNTCVMCLQAQEIPRLSFYVTAYQGLSNRYKELETIHTQKLHEYKQATDVIAILKAKLMSFQKVQVPNGVASSSSPTSPAQILPNISVSSGTGPKPALIDWHSEGGKQVSAYIMSQRETITKHQKESESLKNRVNELTAQLAAKDRPNIEKMSATEETELMEAELEGLHGRLATCEEDLEKAQAELETANSRNQQLSKEVADLRKECNQQRGALSKQRFQITSLQSRCDTAERDLASARESLKAKDEAIKANARSPRGRSVDPPRSPDRPAGERTMIYIPTPAELKQSAELLTSLQNNVSRLNREKSAIEQEIIRLKGSLKAKDEENQTIGGKLRQSAELAAELGKLHLAANSRAEAAEEKLLDIQKEMQELKELMDTQARENNAMQNTASIASGLTKIAEKSRIAQLESQLAEVARVRDKAIAQSEIWQENRNSWKRWGEMMALRAKQWEDEAAKAKTPSSKDPLSVQPEEPPNMSSGPPSELGKSRKRPFDMPDTDIDAAHAATKPHSDDGAPLTVDLGEEGTERKRARFAS